MRALALIGIVVLAVFCFVWHSSAAPVVDTIYGKVTFEDGTSPLAARVKWLSLDPVDGLKPVPNRENEMVCPNGAFKFEKMPKGPFRFEATARPASAKFDWYAVVPMIKAGTPNVKIVMKCGSSLSGRVVDSKDAAVPAFKIGVLQRYKLGGPKDTATATSGPSARDFKDDEGRFEFECLPDGEWEIFIATGTGAPLKSTRVTLPYKGEPLTLTMPSFTEVKSIAGRVVDPQGNPVAGAKVRAAVERGKKADADPVDDTTATTDKDGNYRLEKLTTWPVRVSAAAPGFGRTEVKRLDGTESMFELELKLRASCKLTGDVTDANDQPVSDCNVKADVEGEAITRADPQAKTDAKGHFEITDLAPGPNTVAAFTEDGEDELVAVKRVVLAVDAPAKVKLKLKLQKQ